MCLRCVDPPVSQRRTRQADPLGTAVALALGSLVGIALAAPALPPGLSLRLGGTSIGTVGTAMLVGALAVVLLPIGILALYQVFALMDR